MAKVRMWATSAGAAEAGDVISVIDDDQEFSDSDKSDAFSYIVSLPGVSVEKASQLRESVYRPAVEGDPEFEFPDEEDRRVLVYKKKWRFKTEGLRNLYTDKEYVIRDYDLDVAVENRKDKKKFIASAKES